jgi:PilZ domain
MASRPEQLRSSTGAGSAGALATSGRRLPRVTGVPELSIRIHHGLGRTETYRVLNISERGAFVAGSGFEVGEIVDFELRGPDFDYGGRAEVMHCCERGFGLHVMFWEGPSERALRAFVRSRLSHQAW